MDTKTICILGAARNVAKYLPSVLENITEIEGWWKESKVVIFENDSIDETPSLLSSWAKEGRHRQIITETKLDVKFPDRIDRLAYIRNRLLQYIPNSFDYFMMVDLDSVFVTPVKKESFESCFAMNNWDVVTANGYEYYYDLWPLRIPGIIEFDCWKQYGALMSTGRYTEESAIEEAIHKYKHMMLNAKEPIVVFSAFNTAMIAKVSSIRRCCRYSSRLGKDLVCEHVPFQNCLRSHGARIVFNPDFRL